MNRKWNVFFFVPSLVCEKLIIVEEKGREGNIRKRKKEPRKIKKEDTVTKKDKRY